MTITIGDTAPDFTLQSDQNENITLSALRGQKVVLYFYPKDNTPGCTREACDFRDQFSTLEKHGVKVFGISKDSAATHAKFKAKHALPFNLLVDHNADVCEAYGVVNKKNL